MDQELTADTGVDTSNPDVSTMPSPLGVEIPDISRMPSPLAPERPALSKMPSPLSPAPASVRNNFTKPPQAPPGYEPGYTAPARRDYEDSFLFKMGSALASWGEDMPVNLKLKLAQNKADIEQSQNQLAWANFHQHQKQLDLAASEQNKNMMFKFYEALPMMKGLVNNAKEEDRPALVEHLAKQADAMVPGGGSIIRAMGESRTWVLGADELLSSPGPDGQAARELVKTMGYEKWVTHPATKAMLLTQSKDLFSTIPTRFTAKEQTALAKGEMTEEQYRAAWKKASMDESFKPTPRSIAYANAALDEPYAQGIMASQGVKLNSTALKVQQKEKPAGEETLGGIKAQEYRKEEAKYNDMLEFNKKYPGHFNEGQLAAQKKEMGKILGTESKDQGINPNSSVNKRLARISQNKVTDIESIAELPKAQQAQAYKWAEQAQQEQDKASAQSAQSVKLAGPGDTSQYINADELRKTGRVIPVRGEVSERELKTNPSYVKVTPEQRKEFRELNVTMGSIEQIFKASDEAFANNGDKTGWWSKAGTAAAEISMTAEDNMLTIVPKLIAKGLSPKLAEYVARRESTLGKFARSVSGEVGVLTNQDVDRVRNMFPNGTDTPEIRNAKKKAIYALVQLNRKFAAQVLAGDLSPDEADALKRTPEFQDAAQGILGSVEGLNKTAEAPVSTRGESLLEQMRKGK